MISNHRHVGHRLNSFQSSNVEASPIVDADPDQTMKDMILLSNTIVDQFEGRLHGQSPNGIIVVTIVEVDLLLGAHAINNL